MMWDFTALFPKESGPVAATGEVQTMTTTSASTEGGSRLTKYLLGASVLVVGYMLLKGK